MSVAVKAGIVSVARIREILMYDDWEELLHQIADYIYSRTPEQLAQLDRDLGIEEFRYKLLEEGKKKQLHNALSDYYNAITERTRIRKIIGDFIPDPTPCTIDDLGMNRGNL